MSKSLCTRVLFIFGVMSIGICSSWFSEYSTRAGQISPQGINIWTSLGPVLDDTSQPAIDPLTPTTVYVGAGAFNGLFKSTNGGLSWNAINNGLLKPNGQTETVNAIAINPVDTSILYAGTSDNGVFRSTDGGAKWVVVNQGLPARRPVKALLVHPTTPSIICAGLTAGVDVGIYRSTDSGATWQPANFPSDINVFIFAVNPSSPDIMYAGTEKGVFRSFDGGASWTPCNTGLPIRFSILAVPGLAIHPQTPSTLYVGAQGIDEDGAYRSLNGGDSWNAINIGLTNRIVNAIAINPMTPTTLYAGTNGGGVFQSTDGGESWSSMNEGLVNRFGRAPEVTSLAISSGRPTTLYAGTDEGVYGITFAEDTTPPVVSNVSLSKKKVKRKTAPTVTITWLSSDNTNVASHDIDFAPDGVNFTVSIASDLAGNTRSFNWPIGTDFPKTKNGLVRVRAHDQAGNAGSAISRNLVIK